MRPSSVLTLLLMLLSHLLMVSAPAVKPVERGQYPYLVLIKHDISGGPNYYTGTLLSLKWVLTLAEDLSTTPDDEENIDGLTVFAGFTKMADIHKAQQQSVIETYKTAKESEENYPSLLVLMLAKPFVSGPNVKPVQVNNGQIGDKCLVAGWGRMTSDADSQPEFVQTSTDIYETTKCSEYYNLISFESQICALQSYEYSFLPGSAMICSDTLTAIKSVDTYMKPFSSPERITVYVRAKAFTAWMRSHVLDMSPMVSLKGSKTRSDNLLEIWERQGSKRSGHHGAHSDNESSAGSVSTHSLFLAIFCTIVAWKRALQ